MLKCRDMAELVTAYLESALPARVRAAAQMHLLVCGPCRHYVKQMRETIRFLGRGKRGTPANEDTILARLMASRDGK